MPRPRLLPGLFSDGNGIILDSLGNYGGGCLVENNLSYNNGGSGIHVFKSHKAQIDIVNNTVWRNQQMWRLYDLGAHDAKNVRFLNNIVVADKYRQVNGKADADITYDYNIYSGSPLIDAKGSARPRRRSAARPTRHQPQGRRFQPPPRQSRYRQRRPRPHAQDRHPRHPAAPRRRRRPRRLRKTRENPMMSAAAGFEFTF